MAIKVKPIEIKKLQFGIVGISPLIQHKWSEKGLEMLRMTAQERKKQPKGKRDPQTEAQAAMYVTENGEPGIPILAFKSALISAAHKDLGLEKTLVRKSMFFPCADVNKVVPMDTDEPICREDFVRIGQKQTDLRYRPEFKEWRVRIVCEIDAQALTEQDVVNLVNRAGFGVGIGEWRPENGGEYGRFAIDTNVPMEIIQ